MAGEPTRPRSTQLTSAPPPSVVGPGRGSGDGDSADAGYFAWIVEFRGGKVDIARFAGRQFELVREVTEYEPNRRQAVKTRQLKPRRIQAETDPATCGNPTPSSPRPRRGWCCRW